MFSIMLATDIKVIIDVHVEDVLDDALQLPLLHPKPLGDEGDVTGHGDGGQLPGEIRGQLPVDEDRRFSTFRHITEKECQDFNLPPTDSYDVLILT